MKLAIITAHAGAHCLPLAVTSWTGELNPERGWNHRRGFAFTQCRPPVFVLLGHEGIMPAYQAGFMHVTDELLAFLHDDLFIHEVGWVDRVLAQFDDETVGVVGFCGATALGDPDLYQKPYQLQQLARRNVLSNMVDAEIHGSRFTGERDVATLDGMALIVRRRLLEKVGGWPVGSAYGYVNYDHWICLQARRHGYRVRVVGVAVNHLGGQTAVKLKPEFNTPEQHAKAHVALYEDFRDVLPVEVK